jgi:YVTN family beta-propeller protein
MPRPWWRKLFPLASPAPTITRPGRRAQPRVEALEARLAPAVQLSYAGPGSVLSLTEIASGSTPTVTVSEPVTNQLSIDLGTGQHFDPSSTSTATGLTYSSGTPATSQSAKVNIDAANDVGRLQAALAGDGLVLGPIIDAVGGLGNVSASAGTIRVTALDTSHATSGNGSVDLKAAGNLTVGSPVLPFGAVLDTGTNALALAADVNPDGSGNNGLGALTVQPGSVVVSGNPASSAITLRGAAAHLGTSALPVLVGARRDLGSTATSFITSGLSGASNLAFDSSGNLYVSNRTNNTISKVPAGSTTPTPFVTAGLNVPTAMIFDASGNLYVTNQGSNTVSRVAAGTNTATPFVTTGLNRPAGLAFDADGNLYVSSFNDDTVSKVPAGSNTPTPFVTAGLNGPSAVALDADGNLYVTSEGSATVSRVAAGTNTAIPFVTSGLAGAGDLAFDAAGNLYICNFDATTVSKVTAGSSTATPYVTNGLMKPVGLAFDSSGNLYIANFGNDTVSKVAVTTSTPVAGGVWIRSSLPARPLLLGDTSNPVNGINLTSTELARIHTTATGTVTFGDASQTGDITFRTARPATTAGASLVVSEDPAGPGRIVLDDASTHTALDGNGGRINLTAGAGGIVAVHSAAGLFEIATTAPVSLDTDGAAGTASSPLHLTAATLAAHAAGGVTLVTQVSQLAADGGSGGVSVRNAGDLTVASVASLTGVTATGDVSVLATGDLLIRAGLTSTGAGNVLLRADGSLTVDPAATLQASAGTLRLFAGYGVLSTNSILSVRGDSLVASAALLEPGFYAVATCILVPGGPTPITVAGDGSSLLDLDDQGNPAGHTFTVTDSTVDWGGPTVTYAGLVALTIEGGSGGNTFNIASTSATAAVTLVGGTGGDTFRFADGASLGGSIVGGGSATLDYSAYTSSVVVDLQTGVATGVGGSVSGILQVIGGSGTPAAGGTYNLLIGAGGNTLTGGTGRRNILVAGGGAGTLNAGDGEDLLIAGSTAYDTDPALASWLQIAAYWAGSDDFATRAANLASANGVPLLDATVVSGNGGGNVLVGSGGLGLIFTDGADTISGFDPNSQQVAITP